MKPSDVQSATGYTLAERVLIVPAAHTHVTDVAFQTEMYELFHRTAGSRAGHMVGTPIILTGAMMCMATLPMPAGPILAGALVLGIVGWGVCIDPLVGKLTALAGLLLGGLAFLAAYLAGPYGVAIGLAILFGGCGLQTFSHLFEDVPPPQSGTTNFVPVGRWIRGAGVKELCRSTALTFAIFYWLELWATPRILPIQILHLAMRAGYRPDLRQRLDSRIAHILAVPESPWRRRTAR